MSSVAVSLPPAPTATLIEKEVVTATTTVTVNTEPPTGARLVIGSPSTAQDGSYQAAILASGNTGDVEKQMVDRILDEATTLSANHYASIHVVLASQDYTLLTGRTPAFLQLLLTALVPRGTLAFSNLSDPISLALVSQLVAAGFILSPAATTNPATHIAQKPAAPAPNSVITTTMTTTIATSAPLSMPLPRRGKSSLDRSAKKQLWSIVSPSTPSIDADALLTSEDRARPVPVCEPPTTGQPRRKKACAGCTCGLAELEAEEAEEAKKSRVVLLVDGGIEEVPMSEKERLVKAAGMASKATSSCGSCYLGDAFRCASCPYMGLPAFEPGQKVEIDFGMDDI